MPKRILLASLMLAAAVSAQSNSTMISGEKDIVVIDPQFSLSEARRLAAEIL